MILLTAKGAFACEFMKRHDAVVASKRELPQQEFIGALRLARSVIHNAASISCNSADQFLKNNFENTRELVDLLVKVNSDANFINVASMSFLKDDTSYLETVQMSPYAYSKYRAERYCLESNLSRIASVRFSTLFYKDPARDGLSKLICDAVRTRKITLLNNGEGKRDFIPLGIAVEYVHKITQAPDLRRGTWNIVSGNPVSFCEIAQMLKKHIDGLEISSKDVTESVAVLSSFHQRDVCALGEISYSLEDEIRNYIKQVMNENSYN
ncbi:MAG: NAD-dependent epimerase/dehydratase family protein [bacterium]